MIQRSLHSPNPVGMVTASCLISAEYATVGEPGSRTPETVQLTRGTQSTRSSLSLVRPCSLNSAWSGVLTGLTLRWHRFCAASCRAPDHRSLGRLRDLEVRQEQKSRLYIADNSSNRPNITIFFTILAVAVSFAWLGVEDASKWKAGVALYILGRTYHC